MAEKLRFYTDFAVKVKVCSVASLGTGYGAATTQLHPGVGEEGADVGVGQCHTVLLSIVQEM